MMTRPVTIDLSWLKKRIAYALWSVRACLLPGVVAFAIAMPTGNAQAKTARVQKSPSVVELFTSQGCSSCPPADRAMAALAARDDLVALSYNVDYWDYLGWRDTLAKPEFSQRQRRYARVRGDGQVYTPQMVVNGRRHIVGGDRPALTRTLRATRSALISDLQIQAQKRNKVARITLSGVPGWSGRATVWVVGVTPKVTTKIKRGENRGRKITYHNVVRSMMPIGTWTGDAMTLQIDPAMIMKTGATACAILVQDGDGGPIIAAAWLER